jgi:hypothetical protein
MKVNKMRIERIKLLDESKGDFTDKEKKFIKLIKKGLSIKEATLSLGYGINKGQREAVKLVKYSLKNEKLVKKAYKVIEDMASNKPKLKKIKSDGTKVYVYPTHGHQLKAAEMVYDRYEPTIKSPLIQLNQQLSPIDLSKYKLVPKDDEEGVVVIEGEQG